MNTQIVESVKVSNMEEFLKNYDLLQKTYEMAKKKEKAKTDDFNQIYVKCIKISNDCISFLETKSNLQIQKYKEQVKTTYFISAELYTRVIGIDTTRTTLTDSQKNTLMASLSRLRKVINIDPLNEDARNLFRIIKLYMTMFNTNQFENIESLNEVLLVDPYDYQLHYNLGFMFHRAQKLDSSIYHYKLALGMLEQNKKDKSSVHIKQFKIKCLNGLGSVYFTVQNRDLAIYYFKLALEIDPKDPDINNQIGVVYTELRMSETAVKHYEIGIKNYKNAHISGDKEMLIASMYMNMGLAKCYECDFTGAIDGYNQALKYKPQLSLAYQNKLLDVNYISYLIEDPMYIAKLHKSINKIYPVVVDDYKISCPDYKANEFILSNKSKGEIIKSGNKLNIGFVSGDFICHPVSYFMNPILQNINHDLFNVHCYSAKIINGDSIFPKCKWFVVKGKSPADFLKLIQSHKIDILFDLSGHTGDNRLDTFVLKPAPIQISYCGYPNSSGIRSMDYRITDKNCDSEFSQRYYQEKFVFMDRCFLSYNPGTGLNNPPKLEEQPLVKNNYITFGSFNRFNKINEMVIGVWERVLLAIPDARFVIKTKEFEMEKIKTKFFNTFKDKSVLDRITILNYSDTYGEHLPDYNKIDIALDTFPYSGTTTSCEALFMGVPILTIFDKEREYHSQNVTTSFMKNCGLDDFVTFSQDEYISRAVTFSKNLGALKNLKVAVRERFLNSPMCNHKEFVEEFENKLLQVYREHKW
jgi:protein O-GlcNAc transferase